VIYSDAGTAIAVYLDRSAAPPSVDFKSMKRTRIASSLVLLAIAVFLPRDGALLAQSPPVASPSTSLSTSLSAAEVATFLELHNEARRDVGVESLAWSPKLAEFAQAWADELARTGEFKHRPREGEWTQQYGENIAIGYGNQAGIANGVRMWTDEKKDYEPDTPIPADFSMFTAGHYTQIVWRGTTQVGAAKAIIQTGERAGWTVIVANYDRPGNRIGQKPY